MHADAVLCGHGKNPSTCAQGFDICDEHRLRRVGAGAAELWKFLPGKLARSGRDASTLLCTMQAYLYMQMITTNSSDKGSILPSKIKSHSCSPGGDESSGLNMLQDCASKLHLLIRVQQSCWVAHRAVVGWTQYKGFVKSSWRSWPLVETPIQGHLWRSASTKPYNAKLFLIVWQQLKGLADQCAFCDLGLDLLHQRTPAKTGQQDLGI